MFRGVILRWRTHRAIGVSAYSLFLIQTLSVFNLIPAALGLVTSYSVSHLPDKLEDELSLKHRGPFHSIWALAILLIVGFIVSFLFPLSKLVVVGIITGYTFHIIADAFTDKGIYLLYPTKKRFLIHSLWSYNSGENKEQLLSLILYLLTFATWAFLFMHNFF